MTSGAGGDGSLLTDRLWGCGIDQGFSEAPKVVVPWRRAPQRRGDLLCPPEEVAALLAGGPYLADFDPRVLYATQTWVVRSHVEYYVTQAWERTGLPAADRVQAHNRYPLVKVDAAGRAIVLGGHHRAMAALLEGRPLRARVLRPVGATVTAVLPWLLVGGDASLAHSVAEAAEASAHLDAGRTALVEDLKAAEAALVALGFDRARVEDRLEMAASGRTRGGW